MRTYIRICTLHREGRRGREQVGKRDALALSMHWKEEKEEEGGVSTGYADPSYNKYDICTPAPPARPNPIHPSIHLSIHPAVHGGERLRSLSLSLDAQPGFGSVRRARVMETGDEGE